MGKNTTKLLSDVPAIRWTALALLAFAIFSSYLFYDILSPLKSLMETSRGWDSDVFGVFVGAGSFLNVFIFFLIFAGIILDKKGVRFTAILSGLLMLAGAIITWYSITEMFAGTNFQRWFNNNLNYIPLFDELGVSPFYKGMPSSAKLASVGFMIYGCGAEMACVTVMRGIVKWFKSKELALAMGLDMAVGRLGVATCMIFSPLIAKADIFGGANASHSAAFGIILLIITLMMFIVYSFMDKKLDAQVGEVKKNDEPFRVRDIVKILTNSGFWLVALLGATYYASIITFQKYAVNILECNLIFTPLSEGSFWASGAVITVQYLIMLAITAAAFSSSFCPKNLKSSLTACSAFLLMAVCFISYKQQSAGAIFSVFPLFSIGITPLLGSFIDRKGKALTMLMFGAILLIVCYSTLIFLLPLFKGHAAGGFVLVYAVIILLGASYTFVPTSLWSSLPKLVDKKVVGTAYALILWIQNIGLWLVPILIGKILISSNTDVVEKLQAGAITSSEAAVMYDYSRPLIILACLGISAFAIGFILKAINRKKALGLELPNYTE